MKLLLLQCITNRKMNVDIIYEHHATFLNILEMAKSSGFLNWNSNSVVKVYKWAAIIEKYSNSLPSDAKDKVLKRITENTLYSNIKYENIIEIFKRPFQSTFSIVFSPLLIWCAKSEEIAFQCIQQSRLYYGENQTSTLLVDHLISQILRKNSEMRFSKCETDVIVSNCLAVNLLITLHNHLRSNNKELASTVVDSLRNMTKDYTGVDVLVRSVILPPSYIACCPAVLDGELDPEAIIAIQHHPVLWYIIKEYAQNDFGSFFRCVNRDIILKLMDHSLDLRLIWERQAVNIQRTT